MTRKSLSKRDQSWCGDIIIMGINYRTYVGTHTRTQTHTRKTCIRASIRRTRHRHSFCLGKCLLQLLIVSWVKHYSRRCEHQRYSRCKKIKFILSVNKLFSLVGTRLHRLAVKFCQVHFLKSGRIFRGGVPPPPSPQPPALCSHCFPLRLVDHVVNGLSMPRYLISVVLSKWPHGYMQRMLRCCCLI